MVMSFVLRLGQSQLRSDVILSAYAGLGVGLGVGRGVKRSAGVRVSLNVRRSVRLGAWEGFSGTVGEGVVRGVW